jgi:RimJ/RimL family protein N-acetyltransferase
MVLRGDVTDERRVVIRPRRPDEAEPFIAMFEAIAAEGRWIGSEAPLSEDRRERLREATEDPPDNTATYVAEAGGALVGWVWVGLDAHGRVDLGMGVVDGWRGRGVGSLLMDEAVAWAREQGAHKIQLEVWPHNIGAQRLYEKFGFVTEGRLRRHWRRANGELWDSIPMGLVLDDTSPGSPY